MPPATEASFKAEKIPECGLLLNAFRKCYFFLDNGTCSSPRWPTSATNCIMKTTRRIYHFHTRNDISGEDLANFVTQVLQQCGIDRDALVIKFSSPIGNRADPAELQPLDLDLTKLGQALNVECDPKTGCPDFLLYMESAAEGSFNKLVVKALPGQQLEETGGEPQSFGTIVFKIVLDQVSPSTITRLYDALVEFLHITPRSTISLLLSGGGFRATLYHLGVIQLLRDTGYLKDVSYVTSVSGGSILAAHMALNWDAYVGSSEATFNATIAQLRNFVREDVRGRILKLYLLFFPLIFPVRLVLKLANKLFKIQNSLDHTWGSKTDWLSWSYRKLYCNHALRSMRAAAGTCKTAEPPATYLLATSLAKGALCAFSSRGISIETHEDPTQAAHMGVAVDMHAETDSPTFRFLSCESYRLRDAVAASSAFPPLFNPLMVTPGDVHADEHGISATNVFYPMDHLTDGGVFDNLGLRKFLWDRGREGASKFRPQPCSFLIISDASSPFDIKPGKSFWGTLTRNVRATDILMKRVVELENRNAKRYDQQLIARATAIGESQSDSRRGQVTQTLHCSITQTLARNEVTLAAALQPLVASIRTDLDSFSDLEIRCLVQHGYAVARHQFMSKLRGRELTQFMRHSRKPAQGFQDLDRRLLKPPGEKLLAQMKRGEFLATFRWKSFIRHWVEVTGLSLVFAIGFGSLGYYAHRKFIVEPRKRKNAASVERYRKMTENVLNAYDIVSNLPAETVARAPRWSGKYTVTYFSSQEMDRELAASNLQLRFDDLEQEQRESIINAKAIAGKTGKGNLTVNTVTTMPPLENLEYWQGTVRDYYFPDTSPFTKGERSGSRQPQVPQSEIMMILFGKSTETTLLQLYFLQRSTSKSYRNNFYEVELTPIDTWDRGSENINNQIGPDTEAGLGIMPPVIFPIPSRYRFAFVQAQEKRIYKGILRHPTMNIQLGQVVLEMQRDDNAARTSIGGVGTGKSDVKTSP